MGLSKIATLLPSMDYLGGSMLFVSILTTWDEMDSFIMMGSTYFMEEMSLILESTVLLPSAATSRLRLILLGVIMATI